MENPPTQNNLNLVKLFGLEYVKFLFMEKIYLSDWAKLRGISPQRASQLYKSARISPIPVKEKGGFRLDVLSDATILPGKAVGWPKGQKRGKKLSRKNK